MFSFFHSKKKHSPDESPEGTPRPPIPGPPPAADDDFVLINKFRGEQPAPGGSVYPGLNSGGTQPYPFGQQGGNRMPDVPKKEVGFLQGVPFSLSKELANDTDNDLMTLQLSEIMAFVTRKLQVQTAEYDFSVEKSVLMES